MWLTEACLLRPSLPSLSIHKTMVSLTENWRGNWPTTRRKGNGLKPVFEFSPRLRCSRYRHPSVRHCLPNLCTRTRGKPYGPNRAILNLSCYESPIPAGQYAISDLAKEHDNSPQGSHEAGPSVQKAWNCGPIQVGKCGNWNAKFMVSTIQKTWNSEVTSEGNRKPGSS